MSSKPVGTSNYAGVVDETKSHWGNLIAATAALSADGFDLVIMTYLLPFVQKEFGLDLGTASLLLLATTCTRWVGALLFGSLASRFGRKPILIAAVATCGVFTLLSGLSPNFATILIIRLLFGFGVGGVYATAGALIRESAAKRGGLFSGIMILGWFGGAALSPVFYYLFLPTWGWRGVFVTESAVLLLIPYLIFALKESEVWKAARAGIRASGAPGSAQAQGKKGRSFLAIFGRRFIGTTVLIAVLEYGNFFAQSSGSLLPTYLHNIHLSVGEIALIGSVSGFAAMPGSLLGGWLCDKLGRRRTFITLFCLLLVPVAVTFTVPNFAVILVSWICFGFVNGALGASLAVFETEQYPTDLRSPGYGFAHNFGALAGAFGTTFAAFLSATMGLSVALIGLTGLGVVLGIGSMFFFKETAGRSLLADDAVGIPLGEGRPDLEATVAGGPPTDG
ncbi:MFS transporter [Sinomonas sp. G460-2]|uniref:MFS transporter n=1 Tax=Sinomonas sp. G460-2 TaxID=3393464 RepID=UPI0039EEFFD9